MRNVWQSHRGSNYSFKRNRNRTDYGPLNSGVRPTKELHLTTSLWLMVASALVYGLSLFLPAIETKQQALQGIFVLAYGWQGIFILQFAWFANPLYALAFVFTLNERKKSALVAAGLAFTVSLTSWLAKEWWFHEGFGIPIVRLGLAYYVWTVSILVMIIAALVIQDHRSVGPDPKPA